MSDSGQKVFNRRVVGRDWEEGKGEKGSDTQQELGKKNAAAQDKIL